MSNSDLPKNRAGGASRSPRQPDPEGQQHRTGERTSQFVVIAYDVVSDRRRNRIFKALKNHGRHVQYSVFECDLEQKTIRILQKRLARLINPAEDNIRFYYLDRDAVGKIEEMGRTRGPALERLARFVIL
jgi:CRISPR-associated protein Cas2